jgi:quercetin dioxygenase-like cupin family protein
LRAAQRVWSLRSTWPKDRATRSASFHRVASDPGVLDLVEAVIGPDIVLWGASMQVRRPGRGHRWHSDIETAGSAGRAVSVWIPLHHPGPASSLLVVPGTHRLGRTVQQVAAEAGRRPEDLSGRDLVAAADDRGVATAMARVAAKAGEAVLFDSDLWHASVNEEGRARAALLLQFATPDTTVRVAMPGHYDWPFEDSGRQPPVLVVRGQDGTGANRIAPPPGARRDRLPVRIDRIDPVPDGSEPWRTRLLFSGRTGTGLRMAAHMSTLSTGHTPHAPHSHPEEEVLVVLDGEVEVDWVGRDGTDRRASIGRGAVVHYPLDGAHTVTAIGDGAAHYVVLKWDRSRIRPAASRRLGPQIACPDEGPGGAAVPSSPGWVQEPVFEGATAYLAALHCHRSVMAPGAGYQAHVDAYDVAIVTLDGTVETLGERVGPGHLIWCPMGSRHGLRNPGPGDAHYVVFEFHGTNVGSRLNPHRARHVVGRLLRLPRRVIGRLR